MSREEQERYAGRLRQWQEEEAERSVGEGSVGAECDFWEGEQWVRGRIVQIQQQSAQIYFKMSYQGRQCTVVSTSRRLAKLGYYSSPPHPTPSQPAPITTLSDFLRSLLIDIDSRRESADEDSPIRGLSSEMAAERAAPLSRITTPTHTALPIRIRDISQRLMANGS